MNDSGFNAAGWLTRIFVTSRITPVVILACLLLGVVAIRNTPREENPQIVVPAADIIVQLPGATPKEMETLVVRPLENTIKQIAGIDHTYATAMDSLAVLNVQFEVGQDKEKALVKLYDHVLQSRELLPADSSEPLVKSVDVDDVPIVTVTLASAQYDDYALRRIAERMTDQLRSLRPVADAYVRGGRDREVRIEPDLARLDAYGIPLEHLQQAIALANVAVPLGTQVAGQRRVQAALHDRLFDVGALEQVIVGSQNQRLVYLSDVATVRDGPPPERTSLSRFAYGPADPAFGRDADPELAAVTLAVAKKANTNAVSMANEVLARIEAMRATFVPAGIDLVVTRNDGAKANAAVNQLLEDFGIALVCVFVVTIFFLGWRSALVVALAVPITVALTLGADYLFGPTINRVTLFALILALGMLVDDAMVVVENIHRHFHHGGDRSRRALAIAATNEIGNATSLATFAVILGFSSMLVALGGMVGQYFYPVAFNVPIAMFASLLVAYIVTPWAAHRWLGRNESPLLAAIQKQSRLTRLYRRWLTPLLIQPGARRCLYLAVISAIVLACLQPTWQFLRPGGVGGPVSPLGVDLAMLLKDNKNTFNITIDMPEDAPLEATDRVAREVGNLLRLQPEILNYQTWVGQSGVVDFNGLLRGATNKVGAHIAEVRVNLVPKEQRDISSIALVLRLRSDVAAIQNRYPGALIRLVEDPPGPPMRASVLAEIYGRDLGVMEAIAAQVAAAFRTTYDMVEVDTSTHAPMHIRKIHVDREKAALAGISPAAVAAELNRLLRGTAVGRLYAPDERHPVPMRLVLPPAREVNPDDLTTAFITNATGQKIPLSSLTTVTYDSVAKPILHKDYERVVYVTGEVARSTPIFAVLHLDRLLDGLATPDGQRLTTGNLGLKRTDANTITGYHLLWDGEMRLTLDAFRDLVNALGLALLFIYILLVAYYQSFRIPLVAMAAIPLGLIGVFPGHWLLGQAFTSTSMIGIVALAGIVVRNSLLIIDFVRDHLKKGIALREAVLEATLLRVRPILLTALATVLGSAVMIRDPIFGGLAISLIFGTLVSTFLTIVVVPVLFHQLLEREYRDRKEPSS
ncbi:MAG: efflux RND transporter permease subunit [Porticoccaceae bacterium]